MEKKKVLFTLVLLAMFINSAKPINWTTISSGYWNNSAIWETGVVPAYSNSDTLIIAHPVVFDSNIILNSGAFLKIENEGGLCGHHSIIVNTGASILKYGILEMDVLSIPGGSASFLAPGKVIISMYGIITGNLNVSCTMAVGPWFECSQPTFAFTLVGIEEKQSNACNLFPNPNLGVFTLEHSFSSERIIIQIIDLTGRTVYNRTVFNSTGTESINEGGLKPGIYYWELLSKNNVSSRGKMIVN
ncbi:MAG: T9SS type A sorting domain-containing protein [Bacteroidetes bacterium]|nr:T9SS type A sorting domain-containing protein [Bacteroidota bacterium]HET6244762.1 T9SS type A sorting domain-containing protein [Bacteroidia bacterium]